MEFSSEEVKKYIEITEQEWLNAYQQQNNWVQSRSGYSIGCKVEVERHDNYDREEL